METQIVNVTPEIAAKWLLTSKGNRPLRRQVIMNYANTMKAGLWKMNGETICFDKDGHLLNGHHRLEAVKKSGTTVTMLIVLGVDNDAFATYDTGLHRTAAQMLAIDEVPNYDAVAASVRGYIALKKAGRLYLGGSEAITNLALYDTYAKDADSWNAVGQTVRSYMRVCRILPMGWIGGPLYYLSHEGEYDFEFVSDFFEALCSYKTAPFRAVELLRVRLLQAKSSRVRLSPETQWSLLAKAWNYYADAATPKLLRWMPGIEEVPELNLNHKLI